MVVARGLREGSGCLFLMGAASILQDEEFWRWGVVMVTQQGKCA